MNKTFLLYLSVISINSGNCLPSLKTVLDHPVTKVASYGLFFVAGYGVCKILNSKKSNTTTEPEHTEADNEAKNFKNKLITLHRVVFPDSKDNTEIVDIEDTWNQILNGITSLQTQLAQAQEEKNTLQGQLNNITNDIEHEIPDLNTTLKNS